MTVKISGVLKDGTGKPVQNCTIVLKARRTSSTVVVNTVASENPDEAGRYSMDVEYGQYSVALLVEGFPPSHAGTITVYEGSRPGTLNDFLGAMTEDDVRPEALRRFELMVNEVARHAGASSQSAAAAKKSETAAASSKNAAKTSETNAANSAQAAAASQTASANSATAAKKSETSAKNSETATKASEKNAKSSQTAAKTSETNAKDSEANAKVSETAAANSAKASAASQTAAKASEDAAREYANQTAEPYRYVLQPLPDVWIPFNDSLDMITGYSPGYKKVKIGDNVVQVASDKQVNFSRASTATYINKSGELKTAEINEPRFECDGLLIEGQRTNFFQNSTDPSKWNKSTSLDVTETGTDSFGFNYGRFVVQDSIVGTSKAHTIIGLYSSTGGVDTSGDEKHVTISCRVKSEVDNIAVRILFEHYDGEVRTSIGAANLNLTTRIISKTGQTSRVTARSVKDDATGWIFFEATLKADTTENTVGGFVQYSPDTGQMVASGDYLDVTTPQIEAGTGASSFIVTGTAPVTRASDMVTVPIKNNLYNLPFTVLCEVHKNWYKTPNAAPRVFDTYRHQADAGIVMGFGSSGGYDGFPYCDIGGSNRRINENAGLEKMLIGMRVKSERSTCVVSNGKLSSETKTKWEYIRSTATIRIGGQTTAGLRHLFGHVRNFRLWHKELTDAQLGEVVE
ncbi:TPA: prophage tail fiber N-terminal domain-containing protein [Escherichia coli]|uniref:prophage tail fiber N-terminal domain-containing protein n=10 Tax=Escherichia coli TaxID=562 RepID=UPI00175702D6|nr:prophage tail fiber N-terminal domain-containing protein [Escherichia coli]HBN3022684.1 prophage tail fiber N-terminal domain-containing protein [Escherichia coli O25b:H4-ST131]EIT4640072.1 prophage tail fiber N-terminal domain-containing protein [Escherichia coli]EMA9545183.1 prophage tail fiber N-terminal domain-containing protein [Escherichia coli]MCN8278700.1 prophage tail fiber N-terminal domain-containing protein [Escherichia coli]MDN4879182.1 prophage tail fiber N-terminal domain-con